MIRSTTIAFFLIIASTAFAQRGRIGMLEYTIGLRVGVNSGITYQTFLKDHISIEAMATMNNGAFALTPLFQYHFSTPVKGFKWYMGAGGHGMLHPVGLKRDDIHNDFNGFVFVPGLDAMVGMEYFFRSVPVMVSFDYKPEYNFGIINAVNKNIAAFSIRYRF
ncbi:MAG: hypothetical protein R2809_03850 [Flavobacteriales bacterium]